MRQQSFTMAEAIVALMLMVLVVNLFGLVMGSYQKLAKIDASELTNWYLFIDELESTEHRFELVKVTSNNIILYSEKSGKPYRMQKNKDDTIIFLSVVGKGGYLPLLEGKLHKLTWQQLDQRRVRFMYTGGRHEQTAVVCFAAPSN